MKYYAEFTKDDDKHTPIGGKHQLWICPDNRWTEGKIMSECVGTAIVRRSTFGAPITGFVLYEGVHLRLGVRKAKYVLSNEQRVPIATLAGTQ